jgi:hypothetical protein
MRAFLALVLLALLSACETAYKDGVPNERSPWFFVPVGSRLVLHRSIDLEPGQDSAYLQGGRLLPWHQVNQYAPYCALAAGSRRVAADSFVVRSVSQRPLFTLAQALPTRVARRDSGDGMTYEVLATVMSIESERQPEVRALTCASWCLPQGRVCLTVEEIRRALGAYFTVELAAQGAATAMPLPAKALRMAWAKATAPG